MWAITSYLGYVSDPKVYTFVNFMGVLEVLVYLCLTIIILIVYRIVHYGGPLLNWDVETLVILLEFLGHVQLSREEVNFNNSRLVCTHCRKSGLIDFLLNSESLTIHSNHYFVGCTQNIKTSSSGKPQHRLRCINSVILIVVVFMAAYLKRTESLRSTPRPWISF